MEFEEPVSELFGIIEDHITKLWIQDMFRDYGDDINFVDGNKHGTPRTDENRKAILGQLGTYSEALTKEYVGQLESDGIIEISDLLSNPDALDPSSKIVTKYGRKFKKYVKSQFVNP